MLNKKFQIACGLSLSMSCSSLVYTQHDHHHKHVHAPIGVMGDHLHHKNGGMLSYWFMTMQLAGI